MRLYKKAAAVLLAAAMAVSMMTACGGGARFNPEAPLTMLFDYVKIRFPTLDIQHIIKEDRKSVV